MGCLWEAEEAGAIGVVKEGQNRTMPTFRCASTATRRPAAAWTIIPAELETKRPAGRNNHCDHRRGLHRFVLRAFRCRRGVATRRVPGSASNGFLATTVAGARGFAALRVDVAAGLQFSTAMASSHAAAA